MALASVIRSLRSALSSLPLRLIVGVLVVAYLSFLYVSGAAPTSILVVIMIATLGMWRTYLRWSRLRRQHGIELLGTDDAPR